MQQDQEQRLLLEAIAVLPGPIAVFDKADRLVACNAAYRSVYGAGFAALAGQEVFYPDLLRASLAAEVSGAALEAAFADRLDVFRRGDGTSQDRFFPGWGWCRVHKVRMPSGGLVSSGITITELKETEAELRAARAEIESAFAARGRFVSYLCHELRNPLHAMLGLTEALGEKSSEPDLKKLVEVLRRTGRDMVSLLDDVLDHARVDGGQLQTKPAPFDAARALDEIAQLYAPWARRRGLDFDVDLASDASDGFWINADRALIMRITGNLVSNAVKFTDSGGIGLSGRIEARRDESRWLEIRVRDTGRGMTREEVAHLFAEFAQLSEGATSAVRGSGLGLSIARASAEALGGSLSVETEKGRGSTFVLCIPVEMADAVGEEPAQSPLQAPVLPIEDDELPKLASQPSVPYPPQEDEILEILVAEDNRINQIIMDGMLARLPVRVTMVDNGLQAVEAARAAHFDLILMDMQMPVMDGMTAIRQIRQEEKDTGRPRVSIVSVSANVMPEFNRECLDIGCDQCLAKPVALEQLTEVVSATPRNGRGTSTPTRRAPAA